MLGELAVVEHTHVGGSATVYHLAGPRSDYDRPDRPDHDSRDLDSGDHAHVQCTSCGAVIDVRADTFEPLASRLRRDIGFRLEPRHAALLGTCAACRATESTT